MVTRLNNNSISSITALPSGVGGITPAFEAYLSSDQTRVFINVQTKIQYDTEIYAQLGTGMIILAIMFTFPKHWYLFVYSSKL